MRAGHILPIVDESADGDQRNALLTIMSGQARGTLFEIFAAVCPHVREPMFAPIDFEFDIETRTGRLKAGDVIETEVETLRGIDPQDPYRVLVKIPGGFEYTATTTTPRPRSRSRSRFAEATSSTTSKSTATARWPSSSTRVGCRQQPSESTYPCSERA